MKRGVLGVIKARGRLAGRQTTRAGKNKQTSEAAKKKMQMLNLYVCTREQRRRRRKTHSGGTGRAKGQSGSSSRRLGPTAK